MKKFKAFLIFSSLMNYLILGNGYELNDSHITDEDFKEFAISNVDNILNHGHDKSKVERDYSTYVTDFTRCFKLPPKADRCSLKLISR